MELPINLEVYFWVEVLVFWFVMELVVMPIVIEEAREGVVDVLDRMWVLEEVVHPESDERSGAAREALAFEEIV